MRKKEEREWKEKRVTHWLPTLFVREKERTRELNSTHPGLQGISGTHRTSLHLRKANGLYQLFSLSKKRKGGLPPHPNLRRELVELTTHISHRSLLTRNPLLANAA